MTQTPELPRTKEEWHALAVRWPRLPEDVQATLEAQMSRAQKKQLAHNVEKIHEPEKRKFAGKLTTREDVVQILALYIDKHLMPLAARMDQLERTVGYMALPWYKRLWSRVKQAGLRIVLWLETKGIRFTKEEQTDESEADDHGQSPGVAAGTVPEAAGEVRGEPERDRVRDDDGAGVGADEGRQAATRDIEIVRR